jgi:hypothetical protein
VGPAGRFGFFLSAGAGDGTCFRPFEFRQALSAEHILGAQANETNRLHSFHMKALEELRK